MPGIIDSLLVTLGLDTKDFQKGQQQVKAGLKDTAEEAKKRGNEVEDSAKKQAEAFSKLRGDLTAFLLTLAGAKSLTSFASNLITNTAHIGRLSQAFGVSANEIAGWQGVIQGAGGTAEEATSAIAKLKDMQADFYLHPENVPMAQLGQLGFGGSPNAVANQLGNPSEVFLHLADQYQKELARVRASGDPNGESTLQATFGKRLQETFGLTPVWIAAIERGRPALEKELELQEKRAHLTEANMEAARELNQTLTHLQTALVGLARSTGAIEAVDGVAEALDYLTGSSDKLGEHAKTVAAGFLVLIDPLASIILLLQKAHIISPQTAEKVLKYDPLASTAGRWLNEPTTVTPGALGNPGSTVPQVYRDGEQLQGNSKADRANNPGNLTDPRTGQFRRFSSANEGFAAMEKQLLRDYNVHGQKTVRQLINDPKWGWSNQWAPGNNARSTGNYITRVSQALGISPDAVVNMNDAKVRQTMMQAMYRVESGHGGKGNVTVHVDARGATNPHAVGQAVHNGVKRAMQGTHRVANSNAAVQG